MKKILAISLCLLLVVGLFAGCAKNDTKEPAKPSEEVTQPTKPDNDSEDVTTPAIDETEPTVPDETEPEQEDDSNAWEAGKVDFDETVVLDQDGIKMEVLEIEKLSLGSIKMTYRIVDEQGRDTCLVYPKRNAFEVNGCVVSAQEMPDEMDFTLQNGEVVKARAVALSAWDLQLHEITNIVSIEGHNLGISDSQKDEYFVSTFDFELNINEVEEWVAPEIDGEILHDSGDVKVYLANDIGGGSNEARPMLYIVNNRNDDVLMSASVWSVNGESNGMYEATLYGIRNNSVDYFDLQAELLKAAGEDVVAEKSEFRLMLFVQTEDGKSESLTAGDMKDIFEVDWQTEREVPAE